MSDNFFYFAYGSNLDFTDLRLWCEYHKEPPFYPANVRKAFLLDYRLVFNFFDEYRVCGIADVVKEKGYSVYGLIMELSANQLITLRRKEGYPDLYSELKVGIESEGSIIKDVITYSLRDELKSASYIAPSRYYRQLILSNARKYKFPEDYIKYILSNETRD
ncbi:MAG: gamma-glutamylcyclotransferase [Candidatus Coatesbacteria bacterium]|nr:gamma-glutamylcyclotransferase [Candidatus Coatesbacteria bacterium]